MIASSVIEFAVKRIYPIGKLYESEIHGMVAHDSFCTPRFSCIEIFPAFYVAEIDIEPVGINLFIGMFVLPVILQLHIVYAHPLPVLLFGTNAKT